MDREFWLTRWSEGKIGFNQPKPHEMLVAHEGLLGAGSRVLVPLCGKSVDMTFLAAHGHDVVGIELAEQAVRAFFEEHGLTPTVTEGERCVRYAAGPVTVLCGDVFALTREDIGEVGALYDRAALVALPEEMRRRYAARLREWMPSGGAGLLVTFDYPQEKMEGPPFAVSEREMRELFDGATIELLATQPMNQERLAAAGATAIEQVFRVGF